ncbi:hypothetical protein AABB24_033251 [Solanum stoloniferum]|uniref:Uncharacterized protein n=1 Tax=Solanum stoloniferum TaxID=62892 RepID=A0ABD2RPN9_9SOLN
MAGYRGDDEYDYLFKLVLIGDSGVGKSNLLPGSPKMNSIWSLNQLLGLNLQPKVLILMVKLLKLRFGILLVKKGIVPLRVLIIGELSVLCSYMMLLDMLPLKTSTGG